MATYTEKLGLKMPAQTDFYNVDDFNENFRKIDENTARGEDIQQVLTLADPIRSNRAPTAADKQYAGKLWVVPKMIFNNMMPNALAQVASNWNATAATVSVSGNAATLVGNGTASTIVGEVDMTAVKANDIVYIAAKMTVTADANGAVLELLCGDEVIATTSMSAPVAGNNIRLIGHTKVDAAGALKLRVTTMYNSASAQLGKGVTISGITILDLTADMCQNFAGIEFSKDAATTYIDTHGNFQTKTYELSEYWWICRGSYGGQYSWQRYDDYTNAVMNKYSTDYQNSKATIAEAQAGMNDLHWMTPYKSKAQFDMLSVPVEGTALYISLCGNVNADMLDATFGKPDDDIRGIGYALSKFSWFKGDSKVDYPHTVLKSKTRFLECVADNASLADIIETNTISSIISASPYARALVDSKYEKYIKYSLSLVGYTFTSLSASFSSVSGAKKLFAAIEKTTRPDIIYDMMVNKMSLYDTMISSFGYSGIVNSKEMLSVIYNNDTMIRLVENDATNFYNAAVNSPILVTLTNKHIGSWYNNRCWVIYAYGNGGASGGSYYSRMKLTKSGGTIACYNGHASMFNWNGFRAMQYLTGESSNDYGGITVKYIPCQ